MPPFLMEKNATYLPHRNLSYGHGSSLKPVPFRFASIVFLVSNDIRVVGVQVDAGSGQKSQGTVDI
jgi:hypothetical protein